MIVRVMCLILVGFLFSALPNAAGLAAEHAADEDNVFHGAKFGQAQAQRNAPYALPVACYSDLTCMVYMGIFSSENACARAGGQCYLPE